MLVSQEILRTYLMDDPSKKLSLMFDRDPKKASVISYKGFSNQAGFKSIVTLQFPEIISYM